MPIFWSIMLMYGLIACDHGYDVTNSRLFRHIEYNFVLTNVYLEFNVIVCFDSAFVHFDLDFLYFNVYIIIPFSVYL